MSDKTKHIAILELEGHPHLLQKYLDLLIMDDVQLYIFTTDWIINLLNKPKSAQIKYFIKDISIDINTFLSLHSSTLDQCHYIFIGTITKDFKILYRHLQNKSYGILAHNLHYLFDVKKYRSNNISERIKSIYTALFHEHKYKRKITYNARTIFTLSEHVYQHVKKLQTPEVKIKTIHLSNFIETPSNARSKSKIIIPGGINSKNRDYNFLFRWIEDNPQIRLELVFCGKSNSSSDQKIINKLDTFSHIKYQVFYDYLSTEEYSQKMKEAKGMICPMKESIEYRNYKELYGRSKVSGAIDDAISFNIPLLLPSFYPLETQLVNNLYFTYRNYEEFSDQMHKLTQGQFPAPQENMRPQKEVGERLLNTLIGDEVT